MWVFSAFVLWIKKLGSYDWSEDAASYLSARISKIWEGEEWTWSLEVRNGIQKLDFVPVIRLILLHMVNGETGFFMFDIKVVQLCFLAKRIKTLAFARSFLYWMKSDRRLGLRYMLSALLRALRARWMSEDHQGTVCFLPVGLDIGIEFWAAWMMNSVKWSRYSWMLCFCSQVVE